MHSASALVQQLLNLGLFSTDNLPVLAAAAQKQEIPLIHYLVQQNFIDSNKLLTLATELLHLPVYELTHYNAQLPAEYLSSPLIKQHYALPLYIQNNCLVVAVADPSEQQVVEDFTFAFAQPCLIMLADAKKLQTAVQQLLQQQQKLQLHTSLADVAALEPLSMPCYNRYQTEDAPVAAYIHQLLQDAVVQQVSDIHCEPYADYYRGLKSCLN